MDMKAIDEFLAKLPPEAFTYVGKFAAKLDQRQRCEVLAWHMKGITRSVLAKAFGLDKRTISHIYNPQSKHYKTVRDERLRLGDVEFMREYITEEGTMKVHSALYGDEKANGTSKYANAKAGVHLLDSILGGGKHRVIIEWRDEHQQGPGWYYKDLDSEWPDQWFDNDEESRTTSMACLKAVKENL